MSKFRAIRQSTETTQQAAADGRVFKFSFKSIPAVDAKMWAQMEVAARKPSKKRRYPVMIEVPDGSI